jgi:plastocyanin
MRPTTRLRAGAHRHHLAVSAVVVFAALSLAGCGSGSSSTTGAAAPDRSMSSSMGSMSPSAGTGSSSSQPSMKSMIMIQDFAFASPRSVPAGSTVMVMNEDTEAHTVTADGNGGFDVTVPAHATKTFTAPSKPGRYPYHCSFHSNMHGTLVVR